MSSTKNINIAVVHGGAHSPSSPRDRAREHAGSDLPTLVARLQALAEASDPLTLYLVLALVKTVDLSGDASQTPSPGVMEQVTYHLLPLLDHQARRLPTAQEIQETVELADLLFEASAEAVVEALNLTASSPLDRLVYGAALHLETVRGSAYPLQTRQEIEEIAGRFGPWFEAQGMLSPLRAVHLLSEVVKGLEESGTALLREGREVAEVAGAFWRSAQALPRRRRSEEQRRALEQYSHQETFQQAAFASCLIRHAADRISISLEQLSLRDPTATAAEWQELQALLGLDLARHEQLASPSAVRRWPLYVLPDGRWVLLDLSHALDELWWRYEDRANADRRFYDQQFAPRKGHWLEDRVNALLSGVFGDAAMFEVDYPNPDRADRGTAETDVLLRWGPVLLVGELKAKRFRPEDDSGVLSPSRLRSQIQNNVEAAASQATRVLRYVDGTSRGEFVERRSGRRLEINPAEISQVIVLNVTQHHLGMLSDRLSDLHDIGHFKHGVLPVTLSIADLEVICTFSESPEVLLHYLTVRSRHLGRTAPLISTELDLFGHYLEHRLYPGQLDQPDLGLALMGGQRPFDAWMQSRWDGVEDRSGISLKLPTQTRRALEAVFAVSDRNSVLSAFTLLDAPEPVLRQLEGVLEELGAQSLIAAPFRRVNLGWPGVRIVVVATTVEDGLSLGNQLELRTQSEKYGARAHRCVGLGLRVTPAGWTLEVLAYAEGVWEEDATLEHFLEQDKPLRLGLALGAAKPGRNEPCPCGSGRKFKRCCLSQWEKSAL